MPLSKNFRFLEKEEVSFALERIGFRLFRMDGRSMSKWVEITDSDNRLRIMSNSSEISEADALLLADELAEDIAALREKG